MAAQSRERDRTWIEPIRHTDPTLRTLDAARAASDSCPRLLDWNLHLSPGAPRPPPSPPPYNPAFRYIELASANGLAVKGWVGGTGGTGSRATQSRQHALLREVDIYYKTHPCSPAPHPPVPYRSSNRALDHWGPGPGAGTELRSSDRSHLTTYTCVSYPNKTRHRAVPITRSHAPSLPTP